MAKARTRQRILLLMLMVEFSPFLVSFPVSGEGPTWPRGPKHCANAPDPAGLHSLLRRSGASHSFSIIEQTAFRKDFLIKIEKK
jgi:hypothetical protein